MDETRQMSAKITFGVRSSASESFSQLKTVPLEFWQFSDLLTLANKHFRILTILRETNKPTERYQPRYLFEIENYKLIWINFVQRVGPKNPTSLAEKLLCLKKKQLFCVI